MNTTLLSASRSQRSRWLAIGSVLLLLAACGDDSSGGGGAGATGGGGTDTGGSDTGGSGGGGGPAGGGGSGGNSGGGGSGGAPAVAPMITAPVAPLEDLTMGAPAVPLFFEASGDDPIDWEVTSGALPDGMTLDMATGEYLGTPTEPGEFSFTVRATNDVGSDEETYVQTVLPPPFDAHVVRTGGQIARFSVLYPEGVDAPKALTGITAGEVLETIDRRPLNGWLYGLARNPLTPGNVRLYAIHPASGVASPIGSTVSLSNAAGLPILDLGRTEIDFNPTVDRIRVVTSAGFNFRMNPNNGAAVDTDSNALGVQPDGAVNGATTTVDGSAYTNSLQTTATTTLYTATSALVTDQLFIQVPPNNGTQVAAVTLPIALDAIHGFDIAPSVLAPGANMPAPGRAFAIVTANGMDQWASIDLETGDTEVRPAPGAGSLGFAVQQPPAAPFVALTANGTLLRFTGGDLTTLTSVALGPTQNSDVIVGIDFRPETGQLYALGINAATDTGTLYLVDALSGVLTAVGTPGAISFAGTDLPATGYSVDFNPMVDRLRVMTTSGLNFRVNPLNGAAVDSDTMTAGVNPDGSINGGGITNVAAVAYTNSTGQGLTSLYALNTSTGRLYLSTAPNAGTFAEIAQVTLAGAQLALSAAAVDIQVHVQTAMANGPVTSGAAWAALDVAGETHLYTIDLVTGVATDLGEIGADLDIVDLAVGQTAAE